MAFAAAVLREQKEQQLVCGSICDKCRKPCRLCCGEGVGRRLPDRGAQKRTAYLSAGDLRGGALVGGVSAVFGPWEQAAGTGADLSPRKKIRCGENLVLFGVRGYARHQCRLGQRKNLCTGTAGEAAGDTKRL